MSTTQPRATRMWADYQRDLATRYRSKTPLVFTHRGNAVQTPVAVLDVSNPAAVAAKAAKGVHALIAKYGVHECSPESLAVAAIASLGIIHRGEYLKAVWAQAERATR